MTITPSALDGLRVIDISEGVAAGYCTKLLAGLGAEVIKAERPGVGDDLRRTGPFLRDVPHRETSAPQLHLATGKRSVTLDVACATGAALLARLLERADVLVMGATGALHPSLSIETVLRRFPQLVLTTMTQSGAEGPRANWQLTEIGTMALSGYMSLNGDPDREPLKPYGQQAQYQAGLQAALGTIVALMARDRHASGGQHVDVATVEAAGLLMAGAVQREMLMHRRQRRLGARPAGFDERRLYPSTVRPCADGHVHVHCHNRHHDLLSVLMGEPRLAARDVLDTPLGHADEIDSLMDVWFATRTRRAAVTEAQELRIPMTEVFSPAEVVDDSLGQHAAREFFINVEHPVAGTVRQPGAPIMMSRAPWRSQRAPLLGEHNVDLFVGDLGVSERDLTRLSAAGVI